LHVAGNADSLLLESRGYDFGVGGAAMKCPTCSRETTIPGEKCALCLLRTHPLQQLQILEQTPPKKTLTEELFDIVRPVDGHWPNPYDLEMKP
jgi:hypothetical protein